VLWKNIHHILLHIAKIRFIATLSNFTSRDNLTNEMVRSFFVGMISFAMLIGCAKQTPVTPPELAPSQGPTSIEPIQNLAANSARLIENALKNRGFSTIEFFRLDGHDIFPEPAFTYFENALAAQLGTAGIQRAPGELRLSGDLSKQQGEIVFTFEIFKDEGPIFSGSARIPDDQRLQNTLAQFETREIGQEHPGHKEMPVPTPLVELKELPLDTAEHCTGESGNCSLLLLYRDELIERDWKQGTERVIPFSLTGIRSRSPSGKILKIQEKIFILTNELSAPVVFDQNLQRSTANFPSHLPKAEPGLNTYSLADGRFFDYDALGLKGLAVVDLQNRLSVADQGKLVSSEEPAGSTLHVSSPYIYTSSPVLPAEYRDILLKFIYNDGQLQLEKRQNIDGSVYDIAITDLNRDGQREMLLTVRNARGMFIEVHDPI
jgi:hypothetical protein